MGVVDARMPGVAASRGSIALTRAGNAAIHCQRPAVRRRVLDIRP